VKLTAGDNPCLSEAVVSVALPRQEGVLALSRAVRPRGRLRGAAALWWERPGSACNWKILDFV